MTVKTMDALLVKKCFLAGAAAIQAKREYINELNVFPVPDGDTGTNMSMTIMSAADEVAALDDPNMEDICRAISRGSLRGARGNSGVILSQLLRGFTKVVKKADTVDVQMLNQAFAKAVDSAYKAVMKPKEGTILTVARAGAEKAEKLVKDSGDPDIIRFVEQVTGEMRAVLDKTPEMLPVLKEAGVVDSGGEGLVTILEGMKDALLGKQIDYESSAAPGAGADNAPGANGKAAETIRTEDIKFGYCTEFIIKLEKKFTSEDESEIKKFLEQIGDSIVCVTDEDIVKIHVHTNDPGLVIQKGLSYGELSRMKIDNMREEHNERVIQFTQQRTQETDQPGEGSQSGLPRKEAGFISVSSGDGLSKIFTELGVDVVIEGGQTMNPSTDDILGAVSEVNADTIYVLPNNSNIILAANQAKELTEDKNIVVIPTKSIPQGIAAMINYIDGNSAMENEEVMTEAIRQIKCGQVTYAVRDTSIDGKEIKQGDIMGLSDKTIEAVGSDIKETTIQLVEKLMDGTKELVTLYYGKEMTEEEALETAEAISGRNNEIEVEVEYGGQPIYYYFLSLE